MEAELLTLFIFHTLGVAIFGRFEAETAWWRLALKWSILLLVTWLLFTNYGHTVALSFIGFLIVAGLTFHFIWCYHNHIHPVKATPRKKYYELRKWKWEE